MNQEQNRTPAAFGVQPPVDTEPVAAGIPGSETMRVAVGAQTGTVQPVVLEQPQPVIQPLPQPIQTGQACCGGAKAVSSELVADTVQKLSVRYAGGTRVYETQDPLALQLELNDFVAGVVGDDAARSMTRDDLERVREILMRNGTVACVGAPGLNPDPTNMAPTITHAYALYRTIAEWSADLGKGYADTPT